MKLLIIGIDGGDERIVKSMQMPFLNGLMAEYSSRKLTEDLWTRGWAEIFSGASGAETGAFYAKPVLNGNKIKFTQSFRSTNYNDNRSIEPLWEKLNGKNLKIGFMNFPTTAPIPFGLNGFMVTGAGGGISQKGIGSAPLKACYPDSVYEILEENGYIFDIRPNASGIRSISLMIDKLIEMHTMRVNNYLLLQEKFRVDVGGVAFMSTTRIQYVAMYEIEQYLENNSYTSEILTLIKKLYTSLDENLKRLVDALDPEELLIVSDHGSEPRRGTINLNKFLEEKSWLSTDHILLQRFKQVLNLVNKTVGGKRLFGLPVKKDKTTAFTGRYISGIYVNDERRFSGPVGEAELDENADRIIAEFNDWPPTREHKLNARPYRRHYKGSEKYDLLPDIWIDRPDSLFFEANGEFVESNSEYHPLTDSLKHFKPRRLDQLTGTKGRQPLFICSSGLAEGIREDDEKNLTLAYKVINRYFK